MYKGMNVSLNKYEYMCWTWQPH